MTTNPDYVVARSPFVPSAREHKESELYTAAAILSDIPVDLAPILTTVYDRQFSRHEYGFSGDVIARMTRGKGKVYR